jgi:hypothetical protein
LELINSKGVFSFIVPDRLGFNIQFVRLRKKILEKYKIHELLYKAPFPGIVTDTLIFKFSGGSLNNRKESFLVGEFGGAVSNVKAETYLESDDYVFSYDTNIQISKLIKSVYSIKKCKFLGEIVDSTSGFGGVSSLITAQRLNSRQIEVARGRSIQRYSSVTPFFFEFMKENITGRTTDKSKLSVKEKVLLRKTGSSIIATFDTTGIFPEQSLYFLFNPRIDISLKYITALINSKLFQSIYIHKLVTNRDSTPQLKKTDLDKFPVYVPDLKDPKEKKVYQEIVSSVEVLLRVKEEILFVKLSTKMEELNSKVDFFEEKINKLVYQLYGLSVSDIQTIEISGDM